MNINSFEQNLLRAKTIHELNKVLSQYLAGLGITTFSFTYYSYKPTSIAKIKYDHASENFKIWHEHYLEENYDEIDSTLDTEYRQVLPVTWDIYEQLKCAKGLREKKMREDSLKFGAIKGMSIPVHGPDDDFANFMVEQMKGQNCLENISAVKPELFYAAYCYFSYLRKLLIKFEAPEKKLNISKREIQVMKLVAASYPVVEIAKNLAISERTVNFHIQRVNKKLGTKNKYQSIAKLFESKVISI